MKILFAAAVFFALTASHAYGADLPVDIRVNGEYIKTHSEPIIKNNITYAPIRSIANALGADSVEWNDEEKTATITCDNSFVTIDTISGEMQKDGQMTKEKSEPFISDNRTYIPVRAISELFGASVDWDSIYRNVEIKSNYNVSKSSIDTAFTHDEVYWLSRIINAESGGESLKGQIAVGDVILNRVKSNEFPNTIYGVIFDKKYSVQFEPVANGSIYNTPSVSSAAAAKISLTNESSIGKCLYFFNPRIATSSWISKNREYFTTIGGHDFYL